MGAPSRLEGVEGAGEEGDHGEQGKGRQHAADEREEQRHGEPASGFFGGADAAIASGGRSPSKDRSERCTGSVSPYQGLDEGGPE